MINLILLFYLIGEMGMLILRLMKTSWEFITQVRGITGMLKGLVFMVEVQLKMIQKISKRAKEFQCCWIYWEEK